MSTHALPQQPERQAMATAALSVPSRMVAAFSGPVGLAAKIVLLCIVNAIGVWAAVVLVDHSKWIALAGLVIVTVAINVVYFLPRAIPLKFLLPGTFFLLAFQVVPVLYTIDVAFTNWSTGHILVKSEAIAGVKRNSLEESGRQVLLDGARADEGRRPRAA